MSVIVENAVKLYGEQRALNNVSFEIKSGEIVGFIGPNGAGKSTMMKIICGFIPPSSGAVKVNGFDVLENPLEVRKNIGYLPEHNPLYPEMYVKEYLEFAGGIYKIKNIQERIKDIIAQTGLEREQHKKIGALSKGYRQRVGLAQALIHDPAVLILDEPTTGLDPNQIVEIRNLISEAGKSKTIMLSTHIMQEVEAICDRIIIINKGEIVANDRTSEIIQNTANNEVTVLIEFSNDVDEAVLLQIPGVSKVRKINDKNWLLSNDQGQDFRENIFQYAVSKGLSVLSMQKKEQSLEEVFHELTK
ncbi:MAG: gliding motility-associated ABC transporter ATP-binding subunit GldA [Bacteroidota bacterium]|nr:gliding motility-associated ABC transporter ATP-binding subunit GldA [Bacteroidota bacterium]